MADIQKTVEIIFGAVDNTGSGLKSISSNLDSIVESASNITGPLSDVSDKALKAETAILALGSALLTVAVNESSKFSDSVREIGTLVNATPADVENLKTAIQDFAGTSTSSFDQITQAVYTATSNIGDTSKALDVLAIAEKGSVVGATSLDNAAALLTRTMNAYGLVTDDSATNTANAERVMAAMFATVQAGDTNMSLLSSSIGKVASSAAAAGVPIETVGAALAALTGAGISTDESMTLLNALFKELLNPTKALAPVLGDVSVSADGLQKVMEVLKDKTGGSADEMFKIFSSSEAAKGALILANDSAGKFSGTLDAMTTATVAFNKNYENMVGSVSQSSQQLENNFKILLQNIGGPLEAGWADILDGLKSVTQGFSIGIDQGAFDPVFAAFQGFESDIADFLKQISQNLPAALENVDFSGLIDSLRDLGFEIGDLFGDVDLSTPEGLAKAIQFVIDSVESLTRVVSGIVDVWGPVVQGFLSGIDAFNNLDSSTQKTAGQLLGISQVFETLKGAVLTGSAALDTMGTALNAIAGVQVAEAIGTIAAKLGSTGLAGAAIVAAGAVGYGAGSGLAAGIDTLLSKVTGQETSLGSFIYDITHSGNESLTASTKMKELGNAVSNISDEAAKAAPDIHNYDAEVQAASDSGFDFAAAVNDVANSLGLMGDSADDVVGSFGTLAEAESAALAEIDKGKTTAITFSDGMYQLHASNQAVAESSNDVAIAVEDTSKAMVRGSAEWERVQNVMLETTKQANYFQIKLGELANERYEIDVRAAVDLQTAQIEADTSRIQAAMQATSEAIQSLVTGSTDLWGLWSDASRFDQSELKRAAERMEQRLDDELELKRQLTESIVAQAQATTQRLLSGEPIIQIDGGQLAPELEMIFDKILEYTQIRASNEGLNLLLGVS